MDKIIGAIVAIVGGVGIAAAFYFFGNAASQLFPKQWARRIQAWVFIFPAVFVVSLFLLYPFFFTLKGTFYDDRFSPNPVEGLPPVRVGVGLENYKEVLTDDNTYTALFNNLLWMFFVPLGAVLVGLVIAVLADRLSGRWESVTKSIIFLPMAISFIGASAIWALVYQWQPPGVEQTGLLNGIITGLGFEATNFLKNEAINDFALMIIMVWLQSGFAMVLLSAAIKNVPADTIEAARIDGANEWEIFTRITVPQIRSTIVVVTTTILILVLKVFDVVQALTNGRNGTQVIANFFYQKFALGRYGTAGVVVMILVVMTIPFMVINVKRFREEEAAR